MHVKQNQRELRGIKLIRKSKLNLINLITLTNAVKKNKNNILSSRMLMGLNYHSGLNKKIQFHTYTPLEARPLTMKIEIPPI